MFAFDKIYLHILGNSLLSCHKTFICQCIPASKEDLITESMEALGGAPHSLSIIPNFIAYSFAAFSIVSLFILLCLIAGLTKKDASSPQRGRILSVERTCLL